LAGSSTQAYESVCRKRIAELDLEGKVDWLGGLSISGVQEEMSRANCLLLPSFQENAPLVIAEAMAVGVPVVAASVGGVPEMVDDGATGVLIDPSDHRSISKGICNVLEDEDRARSMSVRAQTIAKTRHHPREVAQQTLGVYREILGEEKCGIEER
jgi:glycosyltransferase involved in cell wall biosynthesis